MEGFDAFMKVFGDITVSRVIEVLLAVGFIIGVYLKFRKVMKKKIAADDTNSKKIEEAISAVKEYREYRKKNDNNYDEIESQIKKLQSTQMEGMKRLNKMEEDMRRRERNKLRDRLLQSYRYYTNPKVNPDHSWSTMESEAFWELFKDYEDAGGDGYMHTVVQPEMGKLIVIDLDDEKNKKKRAP